MGERSEDGDGGFCPYCGWRMRRWLTVPGDWRRPAATATYRLWWCGSCCYGHLWPRPPAEDLAGAYHVPAYFTHSAHTEGPQHEVRRNPLRVIQHAAWRMDRGEDGLPAELAGRRMEIADLGCGGGEHLAVLASRGHDVVGVDPDEAALAVARGKGLAVHRGTAEHLPDAVRKRKFDAVLMIHTLEHCADPKRALRNAAGLLSPSGWLIVETPNSDALGLRRAGAGWLWLDPPRHVSFFTEHSLRLACTRAGLAVSRVAWAGYFRQFTRAWLEGERAIRQRLGLRGRLLGRGVFGAAGLLAATLLAPDRRRYDSVRVVARAPERPASALRGRAADRRGTPVGRGEASPARRAGQPLWRGHDNPRPSGRGHGDTI